MDLDWSWSRFLFGAIGATAPEVLRLYKIVTDRSSDSLPNFSKAYFLISVLFIGLGGTFAVVWGETNPLKSLWVGISLPVIISTFGARTPAR